jgi:tetratricopeptide (TPR) repeat protein
VVAHAGILVSRTDRGFQFAEAVSITVNGKDKAVSIGEQPKIAGQFSKLPSTHLAGTLIRDTDSGVIAHYENGKVEYLAPQGLAKGAPADPAGMWKASRISFKKSQADKAGSEIAAPAFVAFLAAGAEDLTKLCMDPPGLELVGGKGKGFPAQIDLMSAVVKAFPGNAAMAPLEKYVADSMRSRYEEFESGAAGIDILTQGLKFVELSTAVYPSQPEQEKIRKPLLDRKAWLDRKIAILNAFAAGAQWDALLLGDREFERFHQAFPNVSAQHAQALKESLQVHSRAAAKYKEERDFGSAFREFHLAGLRRPSDAAIQEDAMQAWTEYSRLVASDRKAQRTSLSPGVMNSVERFLDHADRYKQDKNLDEALKNVLDAESALQKALPADKTSPEMLKVLFKKADILGAQERVSEALAMLDEYDLLAVDDERGQADKLRNQLLFSLTSALKGHKTRIHAAWNEGSFHMVSRLATLGLRMKADDADLLYYAGMAALILRSPKEGRDYFTRYLDISNTLDANQEQRARVRRVLTTIAAAPAAEPPQAEASWMSGRKLPADVYYDPVSLAFQPRIEHIEASNKLRVAFEWDRGRLRSIIPSFEKNEHVTGEKRISFGYEERVPQVSWVADENEARPAAASDPDETYKRATPLLLNNPLVDPIAIQALTGKNITLGVAGNRFFNPFVWERVYYFRFTYDDAGRVVRAQELRDARGTPGEQLLEFAWSGPRLMAIRGFVGKIKNYERTMQYQEGRLVGEEIQGQGKTARIKYAYMGNRLASAEAGTDPTLDNRSRKVTFNATR